MIKISVLTIFLLIFPGIIITGFSKSETVNGDGFDNFISAKGNKLMDGEKVFRFISYNIPTLNFNEDEFEFSKLHPYSLPDEFELRDVFESVSQMGGKVIRLYTLPVKFDFEPEDAPAYVLAPNKFSEEAFKIMDLALKLANEYHVRIIFSVLNNWQWMGGRPQYAHFREKTAEEFWTDPQLIDDFKATLKYAVNRTNTITGIQYKNDKAIMCWETGNELSSPLKWTIEICRFIKSLDSNHLVMDGYNASAETPLREGSIFEPSIDIIQSHHYEINPAEFIENVNRNIATLNKRKPYIIGEFGFVGTPAIEQYLNKIIESDISGMLIWGFRGHRSNGGFYWHSEPLGYGRYKSYHWPGFESGKEYDETDLMKLMREKAYQISGETLPPLPVPKAPELLPVEHVARINWRGSVGASSYDLYRSKAVSGPWELVGYNLSDASTQYFPLFNDKTAEIGESYFYRLTAKNQTGNSEPSKIVGTVKADTRGLIDNMENFGELYYSSNEITLETTDDRKFKEDMFRLKGDAGQKMIYLVPGEIREMKIYSYCLNDVDNLSFEISPDNKKYVPVKSERTSYNNGKGDYDYWVPIAYCFKTESQNHYLKINFMRETQVSRLEIYYK
jgi:mannan endo-1,4-beta-mannosidase